MDLLYFAWVREAMGTGHEQVELPAEVATVADLIAWLAQRHGAVFADVERLRAAVDQRFVPLDTPLAGATEVAIFPPVTGG